MSDASENLRNNQEQADMDGCMVKVSRQAVEEVLEQHKKMLAALLHATDMADENMKKKFSGRTDECSRAYAICIAAINKAK